MTNSLNVWMNGQLVGTWGRSRSTVAVFQYDSSWLQSSASRPLSLSLPMTAGNAAHRGAAVDNYFENLLPDSDIIRQRIRTRYKTSSIRAFELLTAIGRDCVGAVQLLPPDLTPDGWGCIQSEPMTDADVANALRAATSSGPLGQRNDPAQDFRISIAGAQEKTALLRFGGAWHRPQGATPTTHILKLPLGLVGNMRADLWDSVENEWLCAKILTTMGLPMAHTEMAQFEDQKVLVVERFDRRWLGLAPGLQHSPGFHPAKTTWIARLPQEDFCQVTATAPSRKYEADGGPGIAQGLAILAGSSEAREDQTTFALAQLAFWLLMATDGHAKNFSIALHPGGEFRMTPLYDVLSAWPLIGKGANQLAKQNAKLAMALHAKSAHYKMGEIRVRHWQRLAASCKAEDTWVRMVKLVQLVDQTLNQVGELLPPGFPERTWQKVSAGVRLHAAQFLREMEEAKLHHDTK